MDNKELLNQIFQLAEQTKAKPRKKRVYSEEYKEVLRQRLAKGRQIRKQNVANGKKEPKPKEEVVKAPEKKEPVLEDIIIKEKAPEKKEVVVKATEKKEETPELEKVKKPIEKKEEFLEDVIVKEKPVIRQNVYRHIGRRGGMLRFNFC